MYKSLFGGRDGCYKKYDHSHFGEYHISLYIAKSDFIES